VPADELQLASTTLNIEHITILIFYRWHGSLMSATGSCPERHLLCDEAG